MALVASTLVLLHQEHHYERDPALRARAGLVDAGSDISLMRARNFGAALAAIAKHGGVARTLSVTPSKVSATLVSASGAETIVTVTPGINVDTIDTHDRVRDHSGVALGTIPAAGPAQILVRAQARFGLKPKEFERLELDLPIAGKPAYWSASWTQPTDDDGVLAALDGTHLRRPFGGAG